MDECEPPAAKKIRPDDDDPVCNSDSKQKCRDPEGGRFGKRRKFAVLLSYSGKGYMGMQKNPGVPTIEEDLLEAMCKASAFPPSMKSDLSKLKFQRCARTDKGVSAARQLVSIKIRVMAAKRVTKSFDSRYACGGRMYEYVVPTYAFAPYHQSTAHYRMPDATVEQVERLLQRYVGTHNYHNFTAGKKYKDMSSNRYIISFKTGERFVASDEDASGKQMEFIPLRVKGQSFLLHQIRKMIGLVIGVVRGRLEEEEFPAAFQEKKFDIPKAPALGLLLENVYFDGYNTKFCSSGERERLEWEGLRPQIEEFKKKHIYHSIIETEIRELACSVAMAIHRMMKWLHTLQIHNFHETAARLEGTQPADEGTTKSPTGTSDGLPLSTSDGLPVSTSDGLPVSASDVPSAGTTSPSTKTSDVQCTGTTGTSSTDLPPTRTSDVQCTGTLDVSSTGTLDVQSMALPTGTLDVQSMALPTGTSDVQSTGTLPTGTSDVQSTGTLPTGTSDVQSTGTLPTGTSDVQSMGTLPSGTSDVQSMGTLPTGTSDVQSMGTLPTGT